MLGAKFRFAALITFVATGCGGSAEPTPPVRRDGGGTVRSLSAQNLIAYEGQHRFVTVIDADPDTDLANASVAPRDSSARLVVEESVCVTSACAVRLSISDTTPSTGNPIPRLADTSNEFLWITLADGSIREVLITVWPVDAIQNNGSPAQVHGNYYVASASSIEGGLFQGMRGGEPVRWLVFGDVQLAGGIDLSGNELGPGPGGGEGGQIGQMAMGPGAGGTGTGGGGGGSLAAGQMGSGAIAGSPGAAIDPACVTDLGAENCGGGGGGGGLAGAGGHGAGALMLVALGRLELGALRALGAPGSDALGAGGGGGGGLILLAGESLAESASFEIEGGAGGSDASAPGGRGAAGWVRIDAPNAPVALRGIAFDVAAADLIVDSADYVVRGAGAPGATIMVDAIDRAVTGSAIANDEGAFEIPLTLEPGLNRLRLMQRRAEASADERAWNGSSFESVRVGTSTLPTPVGGTLDVAYVPAN